MKLQPTHRAVLLALYNLARDNAPADLAVIAEELCVSCVAVDEILQELDHAGLADAERVRLTLPGLAIAVATDGRRALRERDRGRRRSASRAA